MFWSIGGCLSSLEGFIMQNALFRLTLGLQTPNSQHFGILEFIVPEKHVFSLMWYSNTRIPACSSLQQHILGFDLGLERPNSNILESAGRLGQVWCSRHKEAPTTTHGSGHRSRASRVLDGAMALRHEEGVSCASDANMSVFYLQPTSCL